MTITQQAYVIVGLRLCLSNKSKTPRTCPSLIKLTFVLLNLNLEWMKSIFFSFPLQCLVRLISISVVHYVHFYQLSLDFLGSNIKLGNKPWPLKGDSGTEKVLLALKQILAQKTEKQTLKIKWCCFDFALYFEADMWITHFGSLSSKLPMPKQWQQVETKSSDNNKSSVFQFQCLFKVPVLQLWGHVFLFKATIKGQWSSHIYWFHCVLYQYITVHCTQSCF